MNLKVGKVFFGLWFQRFQSMIIWPIAFGPGVWYHGREGKAEEAAPPALWEAD
jgi:hypothetical protein